MATLDEAKQKILDLIGAHDGGQRIDEGDDSFTQFGLNDLGRGYKALIDAQIAAENAGVPIGDAVTDGVEFIDC